MNVSSIHCYKVEVASVSCGQSCSVRIRAGHKTEEWLKNLNIRKGMVLIENRKSAPVASYQFKAELTICDKNQPDVVLPPFYEPTITSCTFRQTCILVGDENHSPMMFPKKSKPSLVISPDEKEAMIENCDQSDDILSKKKSTLSMCDDSPVDLRSGLHGMMSETSDYTPPTLRKFRSKSKDGIEILSKSENSEKSVPSKAKRHKFPQQCGIDDLLREKGKEVSRPLQQPLILKQNGPSTVIFRFKYHPEYIQTGYMILINDEKLKAVGKVTQIYSL